jgi:hypothetical protein
MNNGNIYRENLYINKDKGNNNMITNNNISSSTNNRIGGKMHNIDTYSNVNNIPYNMANNNMANNNMSNNMSNNNMFNNIGYNNKAINAPLSGHVMRMKRG